MTEFRQVDPWGARHAIRARGMLMGNRGDLRNSEGALTRAWSSKGWVTCLLAMPTNRRPPTPSRPLQYTKLFFLDEATAFSAGHRPCRYCQRDRFDSFKAAWCEAQGLALDTTISEVDRILHEERTTATRGKRTFVSVLRALPSGAMFEHGGHAILAMGESQFRWSFNGYEPYTEADAGEQVQVLTPRSIVQAFARRWVPKLHPTATRCT